ncbi:MAG: N-acetylmuramoyl-L-alanine amidase [Robiginitomaculum sp.]|nr:N-acetylmuramoyl-L-alanine amidase [Robiginitomaculum sp.]
MTLILLTLRLSLLVRLSALAMVLVGLMAPGSTAYARMSKISIYEDSLYISETGRTHLRLQVNVKSAPNVFFMAGDKPRIVIDFKGAELGKALVKQADGKTYFAGSGGITKLRFARRGERDIRFVADMAQGAKYLSHSYANEILEVVISYQDGSKDVSPYTVRAGGLPTPRLKPGLRVQTRGGIPVPRLKTSRRKHFVKKPIIVIDPGHGGRDPGAVGAARVIEEHVTLKAAIELRKQLLAGGKYKVVLTRTRDIYVDHDKRVLIARKAGADLFISLHADSLKSSTARGASVYTLSSRAEARTHKIVKGQNWVLDVDLASTSAPVGNILVDLAQRKTLTRSERFSDILIPELKKSSKLLNNTHRRAGFYVLLAPDVPAVLLEMGFLSNPQDEKLLNTAAHRKKLMKSVVRAIDKYFAQ